MPTRTHVLESLIAKLRRTGCLNHIIEAAPMLSQEAITVILPIMTVNRHHFICRQMGDEVELRTSRGGNRKMYGSIQLQQLGQDTACRSGSKEQDGAPRLESNQVHAVNSAGGRLN